MPIPEPQDDEDGEEFLDRCMSDEDVKDEFGAGSDQAFAVCAGKAEDAGLEVPESRDAVGGSVLEELKDTDDIGTLVDRRLGEQAGSIDLEEMLMILSEAVRSAFDLQEGDPKRGFRDTNSVPGRRKLIDEGEDSVSIEVDKLRRDVSPDEIGTAIHEPAPGEGTLNLILEKQAGGSFRFVVEKGVTDVVTARRFPGPTRDGLLVGMRDALENAVDESEFRVGFFGVV